MGAGKKKVQDILICLAVLFYTATDSSTLSSTRTETSTVYPLTTSHDYLENTSSVDTSSTIPSNQTTTTQTLTTQTCRVENCKSCESGRQDSCEVCEDDYHTTDQRNSTECTCKTICHSCHDWFWVCITVPVVGGLIIIGVVIGIIIVCVRRHRSKKGSDTSSVCSPEPFRRSPPSKMEVDNVRAVDLSVIPVYENVDRPSAHNLVKDIEEGHDKVLRYTREPTVKDRSGETGEKPVRPSRRSYPTESTLYEPVDALQNNDVDGEKETNFCDDSDDYYVNHDQLRKLVKNGNLKSVEDDNDNEQDIYENVNQDNVYYNAAAELS